MKGPDCIDTIVVKLQNSRSKMISNHLDKLLVIKNVPQDIEMAGSDVHIAEIKSLIDEMVKNGSTTFMLESLFCCFQKLVQSTIRLYQLRSFVVIKAIKECVKLFDSILPSPRTVLSGLHYCFLDHTMEGSFR